MDPLVDLTGQPYAYAGDDPVNLTDPLGLKDTLSNSVTLPGIGYEIIVSGNAEVKSGPCGVDFGVTSDGTVDVTVACPRLVIHQL